MDGALPREQYAKEKHEDPWALQGQQRVSETLIKGKTQEKEILTLVALFRIVLIASDDKRDLPKVSARVDEVAKAVESEQQRPM